MTLRRPVDKEKAKQFKSKDLSIQYALFSVFGTVIVKAPRITFTLKKWNFEMSMRMILVTLLLTTVSMGCNTREWDDTGINGKAKLKIVNGTTATAGLVVEGKFEGTIAPNTARVFGVEPGRFAVSVGLDDTGQVFEFGEVRLRSYNRQTFVVTREEPPILPPSNN